MKKQIQGVVRFRIGAQASSNKKAEESLMD